MDSSGTIQSLYDQDGLLDILLGVEEYFDNMDIYAYKNWIEGEVVEGPVLSKYWCEVTLKFNHSTFPDPEAVKILEEQGTIVSVKKDWEIHPIQHPRSNADMDSITGNVVGQSNPKDEKEPIILFKFKIPRRLIDPESLDEYKLETSTFNMNMDDGTESDSTEPQVQSEGQDDDLDFDEVEL